MNPLFLLLWVLSLIPLFFIPFGIALFYQRIFKHKTYPYLFLVALVQIASYSLSFLVPSFPIGLWFFAMGGAILGMASIRLNSAMTRRK